MKDLKLKLEDLKELKERYYIGSQDAYRILKKFDGLYEIESDLKDESRKMGLRPEKVVPDIFEIQKLVNFFNFYCGVLKRSFSGLDWAKETKRTLKKYFEFRFEKVTTSLSFDEGYLETAVEYTRQLNEFLSKGDKTLERKLNEDTELFSWFYEKDPRNSLDFDGVNTFKLFKRLKREQILHRDSSQRIFLIQLFESYAIRDMNDFHNFVQVCLCNKGEPSDKQVDENELEDENYVMLVVNRNMNWIKRYLGN